VCACILTEPSEGRLILGNTGLVWAEIVTTSRAAHGSRWHLGVSAIAKMGRMTTGLEHFDQEELRRRVHPLVAPALAAQYLNRGRIRAFDVCGGARIEGSAADAARRIAYRVIQELQEFIRSLFAASQRFAPGSRGDEHVRDFLPDLFGVIHGHMLALLGSSRRVPSDVFA
jgi:Peptidase dimerisation domain